MEVVKAEGIQRTLLAKQLDALGIASYVGFHMKEGTTVVVSFSGSETEAEKDQIKAAINAHDKSAEDTEQKDYQRFLKRARVKDSIIAEMAKQNMARVRAGVWTNMQLVALTQDPQLKSVLDDMNTLSFEIAFSKIDTLTNELITAEIKAKWKSMLMEHFYL